MQPPNKHKPTGYLHGILSNGAKPFQYRSRISTLLGVSDHVQARGLDRVYLPPINYQYDLASKPQDLDQFAIPRLPVGGHSENITRQDADVNIETEHRPGVYELNTKQSETIIGTVDERSSTKEYPVKKASVLLEPHPNPGETQQTELIIPDSTVGIIDRQTNNGDETKSAKEDSTKKAKLFTDKKESPSGVNPVSLFKDATQAAKMTMHQVPAQSGYRKADRGSGQVNPLSGYDKSSDCKCSEIIQSYPAERFTHGKNMSVSNKNKHENPTEKNIIETNTQAIRQDYHITKASKHLADKPKSSYAGEALLTSRTVPSDKKMQAKSVIRKPTRASNTMIMEKLQQATQNQHNLRHAETDRRSTPMKGDVTKPQVITQPVVIMNQTRTVNKTPMAFWERSHLGALGTRIYK